MTITTPAPAAIHQLTALDAAPDMVPGNGPGHLADLLEVQAPNTATLAVLSDKSLASGLERGIIAARILAHLVPDGVQIEEQSWPVSTSRTVSLHRDGVDQIVMHFLDLTAEVSVHIDSDDPDQDLHQFVPAAEMFDVVRAYYRS